MKKKRFQWLSNLRKFVRNNLCWWIRKKNERKQEIDDIEIESLPEAPLYSQQISVTLSPQPSISQSADISSEFRESLCQDIFSLENDDSLLILLTQRNVRRLSFPGVRLKTLPVIPLPWVKKLSDIREGNILEFQIELPMTTRYLDLERSWMTSRIFECSWGSYSSLLSKMQIVPYERQRSSWYLELASGEPHGQNAPFSTARHETSVSTHNIPEGDMQIKVSEIFTTDAKSGETIADIPPLHTIRVPFVPDHSKSRLPSTDTLEVNWSVNAVNIKEMHLTSLLAEDGDYKKLYKGHNEDIKFIVTVYRRVPKKLDMNDLARLKSPYLAELYGIFQYNSHRWITYVEATYGDLHSILKLDLQRTVFGEYEAKFVVVRLLSALAYLHRQGVVHGDIRPRKIFINNLGMPLLGGLETVTWPSNKTLVMKSENSMKIGFVAPEVVTGFRPQPASDIFSVGCVAYFIATGSRPFSKRSELLNKMVGPKLMDTKLSLGGLEFISACLQKHMGKRFHLGIGLRYVRQIEWFADMDVYDVSPRSPLIKAMERINKDVTVRQEEKGIHV